MMRVRRAPHVIRGLVVLWRKGPGFLGFSSFHYLEVVQSSVWTVAGSRSSSGRSARGTSGEAIPARKPPRKAIQGSGRHRHNGAAHDYDVGSSQRVGSASSGTHGSGWRVMRLRRSRRTSSMDHNQMTCPSASEKCSAQVCPPATHGKGERPGRWTACRSNGVVVVRCPPARPPGSLAREAAGPQRRQDPLARLCCAVVRPTSNRGEKPARASPQPLLLRGPRQTDNAGLPAQLPPPCWPPCWAPALLSAPPCWPGCCPPCC